MADTGGISAGEVGGIFAGVVAVLAVVGKGAAWLLNWNDARANSRSTKLQKWHEELEAREARIDAAISDRLTRIENEHVALKRAHGVVVIRLDRARSAYRVIAAELISIAPHSAALMQATAILDEPLPVPAVPGAEALLIEIDAADGAAE